MIFYIIGKSSSGKDTIYKKLLDNTELQLKRMVGYTTRPIRENETNGVEYYFVDEEKLKELENQNKIIELRSYNTIHGIWKYFTVYNENIDLICNDYLAIGTLESYNKMKDYFNNKILIPIYIDTCDGDRLERALKRERGQSTPKYEELCRRFLADCIDFSEENIIEAGIEKRFYNEDLQQCVNKIIKYIEKMNYKLEG